LAGVFKPRVLRESPRTLSRGTLIGVVAAGGGVVELVYSSAEVAWSPTVMNVGRAEPNVPTQKSERPGCPGRCSIGIA